MCVLEWIYTSAYKEEYKNQKRRSKILLQN
jgi:hypothetical protein